MSSTKLVDIHQKRTIPIYKATTFTTESSQKAAKMDTILDRIDYEKVGFMNESLKKDKEDRVIPITLHTGEIVIPVFNKLEDPEIPSWSLFHHTGREKEIIVPINMKNDLLGNSYNNKQSEENVNSFQHRGTVDKHSFKHKKNAFPTEHNKPRRIHVHKGDLPPKSSAKETRKIKKGEDDLEAVHKELKDPEIPSWPVFHHTGRDKETIVPINMKKYLLENSCSNKQSEENVNSFQHRDNVDKHSFKHEKNAFQTEHNKPGSIHKGDLPPKPSAKDTRKIKKEEDDLEAVHRELKIAQDLLMSQVAQLNARIPPKESIPRVDPVQEKQRMFTHGRSRSLDTQINLRGVVQKKSCVASKDKSLQDIDKEIAIIWKELQDLDSLPTSRCSSKEELFDCDTRKCELVDQNQSISSSAPSKIQNNPVTPPPYRHPQPPTTSKNNSQLPTVLNKSQNTIWDLPPSGISCKASLDVSRSKYKPIHRSRRASWGNLSDTSSKMCTFSNKKLLDAERNISQHWGNFDTRRRKSDECSYAKINVKKERGTMDDRNETVPMQTQEQISNSQKNRNPFLDDEEEITNSDKKPNFILNNDISFASDACTQTDKLRKHHSCIVM